MSLLMIYQTVILNSGIESLICLLRLLKFNSIFSSLQMSHTKLTSREEMLTRHVICVGDISLTIGKCDNTWELTLAKNLMYVLYADMLSVLRAISKFIWKVCTRWTIMNNWEIRKNWYMWYIVCSENSPSSLKTEDFIVSCVDFVPHLAKVPAERNLWYILLFNSLTFSVNFLSSS